MEHLLRLRKPPLMGRFFFLAKQFLFLGQWIGIAVIVLIVLGAIASMGDDSPTSTNTAQQNQQQQAEQTKPEPLVVTVDKLKVR